MQLQYFKPKSKLLSQYLEGYYFLEKERNEPTVEYFTFPNNFSIVSVLDDTQLVMDNNGAFAKEKKEFLLFPHLSAIIKNLSKYIMKVKSEKLLFTSSH